MAPGTSPSESSLLSDDRFLRQVAHLYYEADETQERIAELFRPRAFKDCQHLLDLLLC